MITETPWTWLAAHLWSSADDGRSHPIRHRRGRARRTSLLAVEELAYGKATGGGAALTGDPVGRHRQN